MFRFWIAVVFITLILGVSLVAGVGARAASDVSTTQAAEPIVVGLIDHGTDARSKCVDPSFLTVVDRESTVRVARTFTHVKLSSDQLFNYPFVFFNGEGTLSLSEDERNRLREYLKRGGFLLASTRCADAAWSADFRRELKVMFPDSELKTAEMDHAMFHTLYDINSLQTRQAMKTPVRLEIMEIKGHVAVVFSSLGLNGTDEAGGDCCCCGGNEIRDARRVNANLLLYALTR